ncbi:MAG: hypothetical protein J6386_17920 [Candidatus Synoicihabitans palmerolidicus]|nr:hypothetical protein [Candidatus Synoicihabitans palmerolidicus]
MKATITPLPRLARAYGPLITVLLCLITIGIPSLRALDISGTYRDKGICVGATPHGPPPTISFHALLGHEFDPTLATLNYASSSHVNLVDRDGTLDLEMVTEDNKVILHRNGSAHEGYSHEGDLTVIRMRQGDSLDERYVLVISPLDQGAYLEVKVYHVRPSFVGPYGELLGTYIFVRHE